MQNDQENYQNMLKMAEFAATRMDQRKTVEFRIFISYMTPLILATYYAIKVNPEYVIDVNWYVIIVLSTMLFGMHIVYISWQIRVSVAMRNDAQRRNFCIKKAECILHHLSKSTNTPFLPGNNKVKVNIGYNKDGYLWTEKELFDKDAAEFATIPTIYESIKRFCSELRNNWTRQLSDTPEAEQVFRDNIKQSAELGIKASLTILIDHHQFQRINCYVPAEHLVSDFTESIVFCLF